MVLPYLEPGTQFTAIAAGVDHSLALTREGAVVDWGWAGGTVPAAAQSSVVAIAAGSYHTVALKSDGSVVAWGNNDSSQRTPNWQPAPTQANPQTISTIDPMKFYRVKAN